MSSESDSEHSGSIGSAAAVALLPPEPLEAPETFTPDERATPGETRRDEYEPRSSGLCGCGRYEVLRGRKQCPACKQGDVDPASVHDVHLLRLLEGGDKYAAVKQAFLSKWYSQNRGVVRVERIVAVYVPAVAQRYLAHQSAMVASRSDNFVNERRVFLEMYPTCSCRFADGEGEPCTNEACQLCCIIRRGAPLLPHGAAQPGSGRAVYLTYEPGDFTVGADAEAAEQTERELRAKAAPGEIVSPVTYRRIGVAVRATLGTVAYRTAHDPSITEAPGGKDSLLVELPDGKMPEVVVHNPDAVLPTYIIVFQTGKIVFG